MTTEISLTDFKDMPYLLTNKGMVIELGYVFTELTGYSKSDIFQKEILEVFNLLRINCIELDIEINQSDKDIYLFTKVFEPIEVVISIQQYEDSNEMLFIFTEKPNSRLYDKLIFEEQLFKDNKVGCSIYSVPDLILLKSNHKYHDFMEPPYNKMEKCMGVSLKDCVPGFEGSNSDELFANVLKTGNPGYYEEFQYDYYGRGITYWDGSVIPIFVDQKMKYIL